MKKWMSLLALVLALGGCGSSETMETVADEYVVAAMAEPKQITVQLPGEAALPAMENDSARLYLCRDYEIALQTMEGGDLDATLRSVTGFGREDLTVMETVRGDIPCYEFVWSCAGETGQQVGRGILLDDGSYHYVMTALWDEAGEADSQVVWSEVFASFGIR